jgi:GNAT superfamily N-acetyltransferase
MMIKFRELRDGDFDDLARIIGNMWATPRVREHDALTMTYGRIVLFFFMMQSSYAVVAEDDGKAIGVTICHDLSDDYMVSQYAGLFVPQIMHFVGDPVGMKEFRHWSGYCNYSAEIEKQFERSDYGAELQLFILNDKYRGKGIGSGMFQRMLEFYHMRGIKNFFLHTDTACTWTYYAGRGMERIGDLTTDVTSGDVRNVELYVYADDVEKQRDLLKDKIDLNA